ncbi:MAG: replicative DNA helicase, partial [Ruminococcus sp.]|nr:replicative DNA helicase [Ruminococcus sp.]
MASSNSQELSALKSTRAIYAPDAEQAVLGGILVDPSKLAEVLEILKPESFYLPVHQGLFNVINQLFSVERDIDLVMLIDEAVTRRVFTTPEMARSYIRGLMETVTATANIVKQCKIVHEKFQMRQLVSIASDIINKAEEGVEDPNAMLDLVEQNIYDIRSGEIKGLTQIMQ